MTGRSGSTTVYRSSRMQTLTPMSAIGEHLRLSAANSGRSCAKKLKFGMTGVKVEQTYLVVAAATKKSTKRPLKKLGPQPE